MALTLAATLAERKINISSKLLLSVYWIIPCSWIIITLDLLFFDRGLWYMLPSSPESLFYFTLIFILPHIVASSISLVDTKYIQYYKKRILISIILILAMITIVPAIVGYTIFFAIYGLWTIYHVVGQQFGTSILLSKTKNVSYHFWKILGITIAGSIYLNIYSSAHFSRHFHDILMYSSLLLCVPFTVATIKYSSFSKQKDGVKIIWNNYALVLSAWIFYAIDYTFFVVLIPRVIHDITAFIFYISHDTNRNSEQTHNLVYKPFLNFGIPIYIILPLLAICIAYPLSSNANVWLFQNAIIALTMFHYCTESFTWKRDSLHRKQILLQ